MEFRITMDDVKANYKNVVEMNYDELPPIFKYFGASARARNEHGREVEIYHVNNDTCITITR